MHACQHQQSAFQRIGIIGLGLIGGSLAKAFRERAGVGHLVVADVDPAATRLAAEAGCADTVVTLPEAGTIRVFDGCDALFVCVPPRPACALLPRLAGVDVGILSDVASVKVPVMAAAADLRNFIGGHPMAGSEGSGFESADGGLFERATYVTCLPESTDLLREDLEAFQALLQAVGAKPVEMDPVLHDCRVAVISHLPHVAAFALSAIVEETHDAALRGLIGGGFRDTTRIAASSPTLWTDILGASSALPAAIDDYINMLSRMRDALAEGKVETLQALLKTASQFRASIPEGLRARHHEEAGS